ncbi:MAG: putative Casein kinase I, partial [Streblomastix strix]
MIRQFIPVKPEKPGNKDWFLASDKFRVNGREILGAGSFGEVYKGYRLKKNKDGQLESYQSVAVKLEELSVIPSQLYQESKLYRVMNQVKGFPRVYYWGEERGHRILIMDYLGPSLEELIDRFHRKLTLKTVLMLADQMITRVELLHQKGYIHRDIKPDNFLIGLGEKSGHIYLIDFGLTKRYKNPETGVHIPCEKRQSITGTVRYCSMHTHNGADQSRRDDMEAVGYVLVYLLKGYLPWQGVRGNTRAEKQEAIGVMKNTIDLRQQLCTNMPDEFAIYLEYVRGLAFDQEPDYRYCRKLFRQAFSKENYIKDYIFEWNFLRQQQNQGDNAQQSAPNKQLQDDDDGSMEESVLNARTLTYAPTQAPTVVEQERSAKRDLEREKKLKDQIICLQSECQRMKDYCQEHPNLKEATFRYEHLLQDKAKLQDQLSKLMQSNIIVVGG